MGDGGGNRGAIKGHKLDGAIKNNKLRVHGYFLSKL